MTKRRAGFATAREVIVDKGDAGITIVNNLIVS